MKYILPFLIAAIACTAGFAQNGIDDILDRLDKELKLKTEYDSRKQSHIDSLLNVLHGTTADGIESCNLMCRVGKEYETFISDSAFTYYSRAEAVAAKLKNDTLAAKARLGKIKVLSIMGFFHEAMAGLDSIEQKGIPASLKEAWLDCGRQLYSYIEAYMLQGNSSNINGYLEKYITRQNYYRSEQLKLLHHDTLRYKQFLAEQYYINGETAKSKKLLNEIIENNAPDNNVYARAAANMAIIKEQEGHPEDAARYYALSAIADIKTSVKETSSLQKLAFYLYENGDINHAYTYITASLEDAVFCNARLRTTEISNISPLIDNAYKVRLNKKHKLLMFVSLVSTLLAIGFVGACFFLLRQMRKLDATRKQLKEANSIKEEYIGHFLDLCSIYMDRLDNFCKTVTRKITAGQVEDLVKMTKSTKFAEEQHKQFYENFDGAFLHIYPTFIEDFNKLLQPDEQIIVKDPGKLTTELRIFAFLRMGVDDANKIASFLHYSVNTIYTYRNKVKNKAIDREHFEENVMKIGLIS